MLAVLGAVAVQTEGLVGHELAGTGVDGSTDGDTAMELRQWRADEDCRSGRGEEGRRRRSGLDFTACHVEAKGYQEINIPKDQTCRIQETIVSSAVNQWQGVNH